MPNHNQLKRFSSIPQPNTAVYSDENGYISDWLNNDPVVQALKQQTEFIGTIATIPAGEDIQDVLSQFVYDTAGRLPRNGDEVAIEDVGELWLYNGTTWNFFTNTTLKDATTTSKGVMQVGSGLLVNNGLVSVDSSIYTASRQVIDSASTTPSIAPIANTDYTFSNALTSLTLTSIPNSQYYTRLVFTTSTTFTFTAAGLTQYFYYDNPPTFYPNTTYEIIIIGGRAHINYIGARKYPINKITALNPAITPVNGIATWTITNTLATRDIIIRVYNASTNDTVAMNSNITASTITLTFNADINVSADTYKMVAIG